MNVSSIVDAELLREGDHDRASLALQAFGGLKHLSPSVGTILRHSVEDGAVRYSLLIPLASVLLSTALGAGRCLIAGLKPRVVDTGSFLEESLRNSFSVLESAVSDPAALISSSAIRVAIVQFLDAPTHRCCLEPDVSAIPGLAPAYASRARSLVGRALRTVRANLQMRFFFCGSIVGLVFYAVAIRMFGMAPSDAIPLSLIPLVLAYFGVLLSMRITLNSLGQTPDLRKLLTIAMSSG